MNKWNILKNSLDAVFGSKDRKHSAFKKLSQRFDEKTAEHVIIVEYRYSRGESSSPRNTVISTGKKTVSELKLLRQIQAGIKNYKK